MEVYRAQFRPSERLAEPYVMLGVNVFAAESEATRHGGCSRRCSRRSSTCGAAVRVRLAAADDSRRRLRRSSDWCSAEDMLSFTVVGTRDQVRDGLAEIVARTHADEVMIASQIYDHAARLRSYEIAAVAVTGPA